MKQLKYIGMDVHKATTVIAVMNHDRRIVSESIIETTGCSILDFIKSQRGTLHVTFEEGTQASWLYDLIQPHVSKVVVCDPRKIAKQGNKADRPDARRLAELLRTDALTSVYHGEHSTRALKELVQNYTAVVQDGTRVKNRLKALFRGRGIDCSGSGVYDEKERDQWRAKLDMPALQIRATTLWDELDCVELVCQVAKDEMLDEARKHAVIKILRSVPGIGRVRSAVILGIAGTPHRFRTKRQFWTYCGLAVVTETSSEYELVNGRVSRSKKRPLIRGLNHNYNRALKSVFKSAAISVAASDWKPYYDAMIANGTPASLALLTLARKLASITLAVWKKGELYNQKKLKMQHAA